MSSIAVKVRGPGTAIIVYSVDRRDSNGLLIQFVNGGEQGLRLAAGTQQVFTTNGINTNNVYNRFTRFKTSLARMAVMTVSAVGDVVLYLDADVASTASGWSIAPWASPNLGLAMLDYSGQSETGQKQNVTWVTDYIADQAKVTELWEALLQKEVVPRSSFSPAKLIEIPTLDYAQTVLFYHGFDGAATGINGTTVDYSHDGSNPTFVATELNVEGANGTFNNDGSVEVAEPRLGPLVGKIGTYTGNTGSSEKTNFTVVGHNANTSDPLTLTNVVRSDNGDPLPSYEGTTYGLIVVDVDTVQVREFFGYSAEMIADLTFNARTSDVYACILDLGTEDVVIDAIVDTGGEIGVIATANSGIVFRYVDENNYYRLTVNSGRAAIGECVAGVETQVWFQNASGGTDTELQRIRLRVVGDIASFESHAYNFEIGTTANEGANANSSLTMTNFLTATKFGPLAIALKVGSEIVTPTIKSFAVLQPLGL